METLATELADGHFTYTQVMRKGDIAIYEQKHKASGQVCYEVIVIRIQKETTWPNGVITPEHEAYPGSSTWGLYGFTCWSVPEAKEKAKDIHQRLQKVKETA